MADKLEQALEVARYSFRNYTILESKYILARYKRLYDQTTRKPSPDVFLMFLVRTGDTKAKSLQVRICFEYCTSDIPYYFVAGNYQELKFRFRSSELHMELYMDLLYDLCRLGDRFLSIYT